MGYDAGESLLRSYSQWLPLGLTDDLILFDVQKIAFDASY
jgi:hypothetical protein